MANRLIHSTSPYLLQHAHNPVDWYEWGEEAIAKARAENKPILVSIGYSACHWCHVMEKQSFENESIADIMNQNLVCIKVDREERPDVDQVYMESVQVLGINGGWPLNVFLTPDQKPFYGGTYFPPEQWRQVVMRIGEAFRSRRKEIEDSSNEITEYLNKSDLERFAARDAQAMDKNIPTQVFEVLASKFDRRFGGIEKAPKFVMPTIWQFLLRYHKMTRNVDALDMVILTLRQMTRAGLYDNVGGGFARYSVDGQWFAPHFEKMLYDNAQLLTLYAEAYSLTKDPFFEEVIRSTISWLEREMLNSDGGFYSALDADSEGVEGKFYTWTIGEFNTALGNDAVEAAAYFNVTAEGNWEHGRNILMETDPDPAKAAAWKQKLLIARHSRIRPGLDDKILAGWNAMTIVGLVDASNALNEPQFLNLALRTAKFIEEKMMDGLTLFRSYKGKRGTTPGFLEDYVWMLRAQLSLYQATFDETWIQKATKLCDHIIAEFFNAGEGYFNFSAKSAERLIARKKEIFDNVIPSSNSVMARNLYQLGTIISNDKWIEQASTMVSRLSAILSKEPTHLSNWAILGMELTKGLNEIAIVGPDVMKKRQHLASEFLPFSILSGCVEKSELPLLQHKTPIDGEAAIYVCFDKTCKRPVTTVDDALQQL